MSTAWTITEIGLRLLTLAGCVYLLWRLTPILIEVATFWTVVGGVIVAAPFVALFVGVLPMTWQWVVFALAWQVAVLTFVSLVW